MQLKPEWGILFAPTDQVMVPMNRLEEIRTAAGLSREKLAQLVGTTRAQIRRLEKGERTLTPEWAFRLAPHLGVNPAEILFSQEQLSLAIQRPIQHKLFKVGFEQLEARAHTLLPVLGEVRAGQWLDPLARLEDEPDLIPVAPDPQFTGRQQYAYRVRGPAMSQLFTDGEYAVCVDATDYKKELADGDIVIVRRTRIDDGLQELTLKRVRITPEAIELWPDADHPEYQTPWLLDHPDKGLKLEIVAFVIGRYERLA